MIHRLIGSVRQNLVAWLALFVALGGTSLAAKHYLINSTKQINPKVLRAFQGRTGPAGARGATGAAGLIGLTGSPGKEGAQGKEGLQGKEGPPGKQAKLSEVKEVRGSEVHVAENKSGKSVAECPKGSRAISGGINEESERAAANSVLSQALPGRKGWEVEIGNPKGTLEEMFVEAVAYCVGENEAVAG